MLVIWNSFGAWCLAIGVYLACFHAPAAAATSEWLHLDSSGKLVYKTTPAGDRIMDFSHAGYMGGGVALPNVPVKRTVKPSGGADDTEAIQNALNEVAGLQPEKGFRGAVLLAPGTFTCSNPIAIPAGGIVLRGSGTGVANAPRTTIKMAGKPHTALVVRGPDRRGQRDSSEQGTGVAAKEVRTMIVDSYVPSGAAKFSVASAAALAPGDMIEIRRPVTSEWIRFMQMDDLVRDGKPQTWLRAGTSTVTVRRITSVSGQAITVDVPLSDSFDAKYLVPPGVAVVKIKPPARLSQIGIEQLVIESPPQKISHTESHFTAVRMNGEDCWLRDVLIEETMNSVGINGSRITLQRVIVNRYAPHQGSSKPAEFAPNAGQILLDRCSGTADNVWFAATGAGQAGPIVLLNCTFRGKGSRVESHQRWSTGLLYDHCRVPDGGMDFRNRGSMGSGHGWSMGWGVAWNCEAKDFVVQNPPGAVNWMIGCIGEAPLLPRPFGAGPALPQGLRDSPGVHVQPESLYLAQLAERLGPQAVKNLGY